MFNKQEPWYFSYFDAVKESMEEVLVTLNASITTLVPALLISVREEKSFFQSKLLDITSTCGVNTGRSVTARLYM